MSDSNTIVPLKAAESGSKPVRIRPGNQSGSQPVRVSAEPARIPPTPSTGTGIVTVPLSEGACPKCGTIIALGNATPLSTTPCSSCGTTFMVPARLDTFTLLSRIGAGEMGEIYRAHDTSLDREVAIKVVRSARAEEDKLHDRLSHEARAAARLSHPHVAQVHALGFSNGHPYLVMELVRGEDMDVMLRREGRIDERIVLRVADEITEGLLALHREGLMHGDIKPANIILNQEGSAKLVDFGLSGMSRKDGNQAILGTPQYIAPESLRGTPDNQQTDIYSLGATLYHLLSGKLPFEGDTPSEVARARLLKPAEPIARFAPRLSMVTQRIVMRMLEADPARRYPDCSSLLADIRRVRKTLESPAPAVATPPSNPQSLASVAATLKASFDAAHKQEPAPPPPAPKPQAQKPASKPAPKPLPKRKPESKRRSSRKLVFSVILLLAITGGLAAVLMSFSNVNPTSETQVTTPQTVSSSDSPLQGSDTAIQPSSLFEPQERPVTAPVVFNGNQEFTRLLSPAWINIGRDQSERGSTFWNKGMLVLQGEGIDLSQGSDMCRSLYTETAGNFSLSAQLVKAARTDPLARTGLLVWEHTGTTYPSLFFGVLGDGTLIMQIREPGEMETTLRISDMPVSVPCYLRLTRRGPVFEAATSRDGSRWLLFETCKLSLPDTVYTGAAMASGTAGKIALAEFSNLELRAPAPTP